MISRELLSEVLDESNDIIGNYTYISKHKNMLHIGIELDGIPKETQINIYELAHKCKEWAMSNGYHITTLLYDENVNRVCTHGLSTVHFTDSQSNYREVFSCEDSTEPLVIFKACQWILENRINSETNME